MIPQLHPFPAGISRFIVNLCIGIFVVFVILFLFLLFPLPSLSQIWQQFSVGEIANPTFWSGGALLLFSFLLRKYF